MTSRYFVVRWPRVATHCLLSLYSPLFSFGTNALLGMSLFEEEREAEAAPGGGTDWTRPPQAPPLASALLSFLSVFFSIVYR